MAPPAASPMRRCPYRVHVPVGAAAAAPTRPLDTDVTCLHGLRPRKLRATGQRRISRLTSMMDNPYKRAIPKAYHKIAGLESYASHVVQFRGMCDQLCATTQPSRSIPDSAYCRFRQGSRVVDALVPKAESGPLFDAIVHVSEALITGVRLYRFTEAFKAYESLAGSPEIEFAAIRHAISHPETLLSRPRTVTALQHLFGRCKIDLAKPADRRVFYREFGRLLIATDTLIGGSLASRQYQWDPVPAGYRPAVPAYVNWFPASAG